MKLTPEYELSAETRHPTAAEWTELAAALTAMGQLLAEQTVILEEMSAKPHPWATQKQMAELIQEMKAIRILLEQTQEKHTRCWVPPGIQLPRLSPVWLLIPAVLFGLTVLWSQWAVLANYIKVVFS